MICVLVRRMLIIRALETFSALKIGQLKSILETEPPEFQKICP